MRKSGTKKPSLKRSVSSKSFTVGIDLGGTKVAAALVDFEGRIVKETRRPTVPPWMADQDVRKATAAPTTARVRKHIEYVISAMGDAVEECIGDMKKSIDGIGLASAGPMNIDDGTLDYPTSFKGWKVVPIVKLLEENLRSRGLRYSVPFQNDAIAAALGEGWIGRAAGCNTYAMITVGTGIGSGVIFNGRPAQSGGMGSEWGHLMCNAPGISGDTENFYDRSVEGIASGTGIIRRAQKRGYKGSSTTELAKEAQAGNALALELFANCSEALASLLYSLSLGFHPEKFVFSGGMLKIKDLFLPRTISLYKELIKLKNPKFMADVQVAKLGTEAGVIGAAYLPHMVD